MMNKTYHSRQQSVNKSKQIYTAVDMT